MGVVRELVVKFAFKGNTRPLERIENAFNKGKAAAEKASTSYVKNRKALERAQAVASKFTLGNVALAFGAVTAAVGTFAAGLAVASKNILETRDELVLLKAGLKTFGMTAEDAAGSVDFLLELSNRTGQSFESLGSTYRAVTLQSKKLNLGLKGTQKLTEAVALANMMGGSSAEAQAGAMLQFGQLLGGTRVQAQEFNSMIMGMPYLLDLVGKEMFGASAGASELTKAVKSKDGVAVEDFVKGILGASEKLRAEQAKVPPVLQRTVNKFQNLRISAALALEGQTNGAETLIGALDKLVDAIGGFIEANKGIIGQGLDVILNTATFAVEGLTAVFQALTHPSESMKAALVTVGAVTSVLAIGIMSVLVPALWAMVVPLLASAAAAIAAAAPSLAIIAIWLGAAAVIGAITLALYENRDTIKEWASNAAKWLKWVYDTAVKPLWEGFKKLLNLGEKVAGLGGAAPAAGSSAAQAQAPRSSRTTTNNAKVSASFNISGAGDPKQVASSVMSALDGHVFSAFQNVGANA